MTRPYFFTNHIHPDADGILVLSEATSHHCVQVLRMQAGAELVLTDGKGCKVLARVLTPDRKRCRVQLLQKEQLSPADCRFALGIAFTKNNSRNEWLLEKATELGISDIYPLMTQRSEKTTIKQKRLQGILISAMLQSQQCFLPVLHPITPLSSLLQNIPQDGELQRFIAYCGTGEKQSYARSLQAGKSALALIGPEGDFTEEEVTLCRKSGFVPVSLGSKRLRTETAGLYVCTMFNARNDD